MIYILLTAVIFFLGIGIAIDTDKFTNLENSLF